MGKVKIDPIQNNPTCRLKVGSWPGQAFKDNSFIEIFCNALDKAGAAVIDVHDPRNITENIDVLQIHWADAVFWRKRGRARLIKAIIETLWALVQLRRRGVRVIWLVHNLKPHDASLFNRLIWRLYSRALTQLIDGYISLSPATLPIIAHAFGFHPDLPSLALRFPRYPASAPPDDTTKLRSELAAPHCEVLLAFVGSVRRYKGISRLVEAVAACEPSRVGLIVAGRAEDSALKAELAEQTTGLTHIDFRPARLSDEDFVKLVWASDYVVLPFIDVLHSSSIIHALSLGRAVVTPATPFASDLASAIGLQWVLTYEGELSARMLSTLPPAPQGPPDLSALDETAFGDRLVGFYEEVLNRPIVAAH